MANWNFGVTLFAWFDSIFLSKLGSVLFFSFLFFIFFYYYFFTNILIIPFVFRKYTSQYNPTVVFVCLRFFSIIWTSERRRLSIMTRNLPALRESCQFTEVRTFHNFCFSLDFLSPHFLMQCTFLPIVIHKVSWLIIYARWHQKSPY